MCTLPTALSSAFDKSRLWLEISKKCLGPDSIFCMARLLACTSLVAVNTSRDRREVLALGIIEVRSVTYTASGMTRYGAPRVQRGRQAPLVYRFTTIRYQA